MLSPTRPIDRPNLHPGTGYFIAPRVPHGLAAVIEGLTREVLRHRPEDIYVFAAHHFEKLLKLREQYHTDEYSDREFNHEFNREFNLWPTKETKNIQKFSSNSSFLEKEVEILEDRRKTLTDMKESTEDVSTDRETRKTSKQTCSKSLSTSKKALKRSKDNETTSDVRATRIISQMSSALPGRTIQTKDIKQELRRNKLSGEKAKTTDSMEKGIRGERRSRTRIPRSDKSPGEEIEHATTMTTSSSRTSARRPLKKVRRIETESETETEHEVAVKARFENGHRRPSVKGGDASCEVITRTGSKERKPEARHSEHSSERKVSSRALSMDRIRAYVLRKFASTASLEVLRSPTYVEQVQEVIDRAAPIIKERLEEVRRSQGKRSKSVDFAWNDDSLRQHVRNRRRHGDYEEEESRRGKSGNGLEREANIMKKEEMESSLRRDKTILNAERKEKKIRRRSVGSGKRSRRRENSQSDFGVVDQVDSNSKHSDKSEYESGVTRDTLEARLTATQNILEGISKSTSELGGARRIDSAENEPSELDISDHVVSLPIVRPPSSKNSRSATRNGLDSLTLPPISPETSKSTKKKDELSLPVLSATANGNYSARKSHEPNIFKDAEEASTMCDITSDIEDIAVLPEDNHEDMIVVNENVVEVFCEDKDSEKLVEERESFEELEKLIEVEEKRVEEIFKDSLNVTPEIVDVLSRPDSLEPDEAEVKFENDNAVPARGNTFDGLKDKLIEIEMAERSIEKALAGQQVAMYDDGQVTMEMEKSVTNGMITEAGILNNEMEKTMNDTEKLMNEEKLPINKHDEENKKNDDEESKNLTNEVEEVKNIEILTNETDLINETENLTDTPETLANEIERMNNKVEMLKNEVDIAINQTEILTKIELAEGEKSVSEAEKSINGKSNGVEQLIIKVHNVEDAQSMNLKSQGDDQITEIVVCETDDDNTTEPKSKVENGTNEIFKSTASENAATEGRNSIIKHSDENSISKTKKRKKRKTDKLPASTPLSLEIPFSYVLSEGSPCEIPEFVTTVIIPERSCPSPITLEDKNHGLEPTNQEEKSIIPFDIAKETSKRETQENDQSEYGMEAFGEYIQPEIAVLPVDIDFVRGMKGIKSGQDIIIVHQDLDRIKEEGEEGEEEEEKEHDKRKEILEGYQEKEDDKQSVVQDTEITKFAALENIAEHEENEEINTILKLAEDAEEISSSGILECVSFPDTAELTADTGLTDEGKADILVESRSTIENSSEESGNTQDNRTTTSSDVKESTASNRSIESPSLSRPIVPELNLDSLQDNTVSSFKMTANGTREDNGSPRESDATTSLIEPLTSDERLINRLALADHEEEITAEEFTERDLHSEIPEADQLYQAEQAEYEWLEKETLSSETILEDETKSQEDSIGLKALPEDVVQIGPLLQQKENEEKLGSEEEIARELIGSLDEEMELRAEGSSLKKESKDREELEKNNLSVGDESQPLLEPVYSMSVDKPKMREYEVSSEEIKTIDGEEIAKAEVYELSSCVTDISQDNKHKDTEITHKCIEELNLEVEEKEYETREIAPLAQIEQYELLEENGKSEMVDEEITVENKLDVIHANFDNQDIAEDKQIIEEVLESHSNSNMSEVEDSNEKQKENEQKKLQSQEECKQEKLQVLEECQQEKLEIHKECHQEESNNHEEHEQKILEVLEECKQEKSEVQKECQQEKSEDHKKCEQEESSEQEESEQEKLEVHEECKQEKLEVQKECQQEKLEDHKECQQEESSEQEESEQEKLEVHEECKQEKSEVQKEYQQKKVEDHKECQQEESSEQEESEQEKLEIHEECKQEKSEVQKECQQEKLEDHKECQQEESSEQKESEQEKLERHEECKQKESGNEEECKQDKLKIQDDEENLKLQEEIVDVKTVPLEITESRKGSMNKLMKKDEKHEETIHEKFITDDQIEKDVKNEKQEKIENLSVEVESVHGPIISAISEQSMEDHPRGGYWTMETKSSTVETVIEADDSKTTYEKIKAVADEPEIIESESLTPKKNDFYLAVIKIQACVRGFLTRRRMREDLKSESVSDNVPSTQKTVDSSSLRETKTGRQRLRREEALRNTTLSLENAFAMGRLQHTGEFHDSVPLPLFDMTNSETDSILSSESLSQEIEENAEQAKQSYVAKSNSNESNSVYDNKREKSFQKDTGFADHSTFPIMMHLLADASRNCRFAISQNTHPDFNLANAGAAKAMESTMDILMLGYPRDDDNRYLNFITSVEDLGTNIDSLSLDDLKSLKNSEGAHLSTSGEESLREPLALPGTPHGVLIEEVSLGETDTVSSESMKLSTAPKTLLDTNMYGSLPLEERALEDEKDNLEMSPRTMDIIEDRKHIDEGLEKENSDCNLESVGENDSHTDDTNKKSNETFHDSHEHANGEKNKET